jgi:hypothetical protein
MEDKPDPTRMLLTDNDSHNVPVKIDQVFDSLDQREINGERKNVADFLSLPAKDRTEPAPLPPVANAQETRLVSHFEKAPIGDIAKITKYPSIEPNLAKRISNDEDFGLGLMNQVSGLNNPPAIHGHHSLARQQSLIGLELDDDRKHIELPVTENNEYKHFGRLADFLMRFFKSEHINQEDLHMSYHELLLLKSFIARKFNKHIKVK